MGKFRAMLNIYCLFNPNIKPILIIDKSNVAYRKGCQHNIHIILNPPHLTTEDVFLCMSYCMKDHVKNISTHMQQCTLNPHVDFN